MAELGAHKRFVARIGEKSLTEQHHKNSCDINRIVRKYCDTGMLQQRLSRGHYGDFSGVGDYHDSLLRVQDAMNDFMVIPANIRKRFHNNPGELIEFVTNEGNREEAEKLGLIPKKPRMVVSGVPAASEGASEASGEQDESVADE